MRARAQGSNRDSVVRVSSLGTLERAGIATDIACGFASACNSFIKETPHALAAIFRAVPGVRRTGDGRRLAPVARPEPRRLHSRKDRALERNSEVPLADAGRRGT